MSTVAAFALFMLAWTALGLGAALPFCRMARRSWDDLEARGGPQVIGRDVYLDPMEEDTRP